ncbi:dihydrofolate reductase [Proteiniclasticum sp. SCR006]|uniref:Dihydrofolate reductase n=1 Tax=Proteiniclasticum aestuarii TaxID=2817862 RepID=A0A939HDC3_9CLOT|nr:dihydrofolate reductase family protein [Proteiniclasticum aestuarii]MBO1265897.1 dihydrofolate reductase [Proteiniclasticum aestuarii]
MRKVVLYIAMSLDGYIADGTGGVGFLTGDGSEPDHPGSYASFLSTVDTIVMGHTTYHQLTTELSPDQWVYEGKETYVLTSRALPSTDEVIFTKEPMENLLDRLKGEEGQDIWICGGASVVSQAMNFIDRFCITVVPVILGDGISLFGKRMQEIPLELISILKYNGMVDLMYERRT